MKTLKSIGLTALIISSAFVSCEKSNLNNGSMTIKMTDAPGDYAELNVAIASIQVYNENEGWISLENETQYFNVLDLTNGVSLELTHQAAIAAGYYSQLKIVFNESSTVAFHSENQIAGISSDINSDVMLTWTNSPEVIIEIDENLESGSESEILIDFNVAQSIHESVEATYIDPVLTVVDDTSTGVSGQVEGVVHAAILISNGQDTLSTYLDANGEFLIYNLKEGVYDLVVIPSSDEEEEESNQGTVFVTEGSISQVSTIKF